MYSRHPSPSRKDKLAFASRRMELRFFSCGVQRTDYVGREVLDAGCGSGEYSCWLASKGAHVTGIDLSMGSLREARAFAGAAGLSARFESRSVLATGFPDSSFDFVYCTGVLHHTVDPFGGLKELVRVLRPGGKVLVSVYNSISFAPRELRRQIALGLGRGDQERTVLWGSRLFPFTARKLTRGERIDPRSALFDYFGVPYQSRHSVGEAVSWFKRLGLEFCGGFPPLWLRNYPALFSSAAYQTADQRFQKRWIHLVGQLGGRIAMRGRLPGAVSRALVQLLWLVGGIPMFCICGRKPLRLQATKDPSVES